MKELMIYISRFFCVALLLLMSGCVKEFYDLDTAGEEEETSEEKVRIEIFTRADSYHLPAVRGIADEDKVGWTPWILVFKGDGGSAVFVEAVQAFELLGKRYVTLTKQPAGSKYQLLIVANPPEHFYYGDAVTSYNFDLTSLLSKLEPTTTLNEVCNDLLTEPLPTPQLTTIPYGGDGEMIPMSSLIEVSQIDSTTKIEGNGGGPLLLARVVAKMTLANKSADFELKGITAVVNAPRQGRLHKLGLSIMDNTSNLTEYRHDATYLMPIVTTEPTSDGQITEAPVYMYESGMQNNTYLIIQGAYEGRDYYYKMVLVDDGLQPMELWRNRSYAFTINRVKGRGYDTVEDAKAGKASNIDLGASILVDDSNSYEIIANNDYFLGVSNSVFMAYTNERKEYEAFRIVTDCTIDFPHSRTITDNGGEMNNMFDVSYPADKLIPIVEGGGASPRITPVGVNVNTWLKWEEDNQPSGGVKKSNAYVTLKLGNLEKLVQIRQRDAIAGGEQCSDTYRAIMTIRTNRK